MRVRLGRAVIGTGLGFKGRLAHLHLKAEPLHQTIAPRIGEIIRRVEADPRLEAIWAERFPRLPGDDQ